MNMKFKTIKKSAFILLILLNLIFSFTSVSYAYVEWPGNVTTMSEGAILIDSDSGAVLYGKNIHEHYFPASITKILTALIVIENCNLDDVVTFSKNAVYNVEAGSSSAGIDAGDTLTVRECLYAMLLQSANEAANALAEHTAGSIEEFSNLMNQKAQALGCTDSHFVNPSGLNNPEHYTSAYDYALISREAFKNSSLTEICSATYYNLPPTIRVPTGQTIYNHHGMIRKNSGNYYQYVICGKTGYTTLAGNTLVTYARNDQMGLITVVLNGNQTHYSDTRALLEFGFANFKNIKLASTESELSKFKSNLALIPDFNEYSVLTDESGSITLPNDADVADIQSSLTYDLDEFAPANAIGKFNYTYNDYSIGSVYILTQKNEVKVAETINPEETVPDNEGNLNDTSFGLTFNNAKTSFITEVTKISISRQNAIIIICIAAAVIIISIIILIIVHRRKKQSELNDRELRIHNMLKSGWSPADCGITEEEAKYIMEKHL